MRGTIESSQSNDWFIWFRLLVSLFCWRPGAAGCQLHLLKCKVWLVLVVVSLKNISLYLEVECIWRLIHGWSRFSRRACVGIFLDQLHWCLLTWCLDIDPPSVECRKCWKFKKTISNILRENKKKYCKNLPQVILELNDHIFTNQWLEERVEKLENEIHLIRIFKNKRNTLIYHNLQFVKIFFNKCRIEMSNYRVMLQIDQS